MDIRKQKHIPLACRYVPYDQWFLTHVDPTWKIKHIKQLILAKCFTLPFDPRNLGGGSKDIDGSRAPSPITFAPDEGHRPISPIMFANPQELKKKKSTPTHPNIAKEDQSSVGHEDVAEDGAEPEQGKEAGYEEDDEWDGADSDEEDDDDEDMPSPIFPGGKISFAPASLPSGSGRIGAFPAPSANPTPIPMESQNFAHDSVDIPKRKRRFNPLSKIGAKDRRRSKVVVEEQQTQQEEEGIQTSWFTLLRFSTGQVLEDDFPLAWYNFMPHELVELHNSVPPATFAVSSALTHLLLQLPSPGVVEEHSRPKHMHSLSHSGGPVATDTAVAVLASALLFPVAVTVASDAPPPSPSPLVLHQTLLRMQQAARTSQPATLTQLPRGDAAAYAKPYWEGWVRALRTVYRIEAIAVPLKESLGPGGRGRFEYPEPIGGMVGGGGVGLVGWETAFGGIEGGMRLKAIEGKEKGKAKYGGPSGERGQEGWRDARDRDLQRAYEPGTKTTTTLEWRERWVVIKDDVVHLFRQRGDTSPTQRIPLGALVNLRGAEHLQHSIHSKPKHRTRSSDRGRERPATRPHEHHRRSASQPRAGSGSNTRDAPRKDALLPPTPVLRTKASALIEESIRQSSSQHLARPPGLASPGGSFERRTQKVQRLPTEAELRAAKEREHKELERRRIKEKQERELESLRKWDEIGISFPFGGKSKDKGKGKEKAKEDRRAGPELRHKDLQREEERERERAKEREREHAKERERERERHQRDDDRDREKERSRRNNRTYVPTSRDEAEAAGMKVLCAKFQSTRSWEREQRECERLKQSTELLHPPPRRYTSTGPSLAGTPSATVRAAVEDMLYDSSGDAPREKHSEDNHALYGHGHSQSLVPRKASLPGLGLPQAPTGMSSSLGRADSFAVSSNKFGIGGLFGKDKDTGDDFSRREKDERKRDEKEKKAREKEQKQFEKERKKAKKREDDEDDELGVGSALSWKMSKKTKPSSDTLVPPEDTRLQPKLLSALSVVSTADSSTLRENDNGSSTATLAGAARRPKLTISPTAAPQVRANNDVARPDSDSDSSLSVSSPVFAHIENSDGSFDEDDLYGYGRPRQGYRYGGYHPSPAKFAQKTVQSTPVGAARHPVPSGIGADPERTKSDKQNDHTPAAPPHAHENERRGGGGGDRGEWIVLDMGSDQAFQSILRIFHRYLSTPVASDFLPPSITAPVSEAHPSVSKATSPIHGTFTSASSSHLGHGAENELSANEELSLNRALLTSADSTNPAPTSSDEDDDLDSMYVSADEQPSIQQPPQRPRQAAAHPQILTTLVTKPHHPTAILTPALPYPEWRNEVVHCARRYGMREAGRPLELALYGWGHYVSDVEISAAYQKLRRKEVASREKTRNSMMALGRSGTPPFWRRSGEWDASDHESDEARASQCAEQDTSEGDTGTGNEWETPDPRRRMSAVSHVSTIKAPAAIQSIDNRGALTVAVVRSDSNSGTERGRSANDADSMSSQEEVEYATGYAYGQDDEEDALAEGLGSIANDSDEESEVEWFAWTTDLPRQYAVRQEQLEIERHEKQKEQGERDLDEPESRPLTPMEFSNPFPVDNIPFISQNVTLPTVLPPIPPPKTPEEERRRYAEKRRNLEPSAISTSFAPPVPPLPISPRIPSLHPSSSYQSSASASSSNHYPTRPSALSSPSSSESLGRARQPLVRATGNSVSVNTGLANASSRNYSNPMSPLGAGFSPIDDEEFDESSTPPSATGHGYGLPIHRRAHSRSISGSTSASHFVDHGARVSDSTSLAPARLTLHHSTSMPLTNSDNSRASFSASSPHSPTRGSAAKSLAQPISMPILTAAQISQIESDVEENRLQNAHTHYLPGGVTSLAPSPSTSPPSSYGYVSPRELNTTHGTIPRRSSSAGLTPLTSSSTSPVARSTSGRHKPLPVQPVERPAEKGLLRKKRSDLGRGTSGSEQSREGDVGYPSTKQRPTLSLLGLSGNNSKAYSPFSEAQSPTQQQHPRGPRSAHPQSHDHVTPNTPPPTTYQTAKALLRRVRSGSSLKVDMRIEEVSPHAESSQGWLPNSPPPSSVITNAVSSSQDITGTSRHRDATPPAKKKIGTMDRIVRGLDSALEFVDGR